MSPGSSLGASAGGALTQLIALGAADKYLSQNPSITFWRFRYSRYTNFAMEPIEQPFNTQVMFGSDTSLTFNRTGDLIYYCYVVVDLPGIMAVRSENANSAFFPAVSRGKEGTYCNPCFDEPIDDTTGDDPLEEDPLCKEIFPGPYANYTNAIGQWLIRRASLVIGGQVIDTLYADYLYMWEELSGKPGKKLAEMIGKAYDLQDLVEDSKSDRRLYIPLPFWFTQSSGNALPVVSLQFHGIQLHVAFADLKSCVQTSESDTDVLQVLKRRNSSALTDGDLRSVVESTYVYLDIDERDRFATGSFEQLITQVQSYQVQTRVSQVRMQLNFNHPIIELIWAVRRKCHDQLNHWFMYNGKNGEDPIKAVHFKLNNLPRFSAKEGRYFRLVTPYQAHTNIPLSHVYCWSAALHPEEPQPSGSVNFSRIDNVELTFDMQDGIENPSLSARATSPVSGDFTVMVFARSWNVLRFREGLGGLAYSN